HLFLNSSRHLLDLVSFPTRRSSDLRAGGPQEVDVGPGPEHVTERPLAGPEDVGEDLPAVGAQVAVGLHHPAQLLDRHLLPARRRDRKSTRLNSSHVSISYAVFCLKK